MARPYPGYNDIKGYYELLDKANKVVVAKEPLNSAPYAPWCLSDQWKGNGYINGDFIAENKALCIASNILRNNGQLISDYNGLRLEHIYAEKEPPLILTESFPELVCPQGTVKEVINKLTSWAKSDPNIKNNLILWKVCDVNLEFHGLNKYASYVVQVDHFIPKASNGKANFNNAALCSAFFNMQKSDTMPIGYARSISYETQFGIGDNALEFDDAKKIAIMAYNICVNKGLLKSDYVNDITPNLRIPTKFEKPVTEYIKNQLHQKDIAQKFEDNIKNGTQLKGDNTAAVDHIIPKAHGGGSDPRNVAVISAELNLQKSDKYIPALEVKYRAEGPNWLFPSMARKG